MKRKAPESLHKRLNKSKSSCFGGGNKEELIILIIWQALCQAPSALYLMQSSQWQHDRINIIICSWRREGETWAWAGQSECPAGQLQTEASLHHTGRQQGQQDSDCVHSSLSQLQYTNPEDRVKTPMATRKLSLVFERSETVQQAVCTHTENQLCLQPNTFRSAHQYRTSPKRHGPCASGDGGRSWVCLVHHGKLSAEHRQCLLNNWMSKWMDRYINGWMDRQTGGQKERNWLMDGMDVKKTQLKRGRQV